MTSPSWHVVRLLSRTLWMPAGAPLGIGVSIADIGVVSADERAWEPDSLVPTGGWSRLVASSPVRSHLAFRPGRDVAIVPLSAIARRLSPRRQVASLGRIERFLGVYTDIPGSRTLTVDPSNDRLIGLHLDNWDRLPAAVRHLSRNRASVNLGPRVRAFLFVDVDVIARYPPDSIPSTLTARELVLGGTSSPRLVRLAIPPDWAYMAPTESVLHDGSTLGDEGGAVHASALGWFNPVADARAVAVCAAKAGG